MKKALKEKIRCEYVQGFLSESGERMMPSLNDLIKKYRASSSTIYRASSKDKWREQRRSFSAQLVNSLDARKAGELEDYFFDSDEASMRIAKALFSQIERKLERNDDLTPYAIASLANSALASQRLHKKVAIVSKSTQPNSESFTQVMELLDRAAELRRSEV
tara:strand:- start:365 stop:850 length:486 start_codon:yes stop_codon:yes gene_type:complete